MFGDADPDGAGDPLVADGEERTLSARVMRDIERSVIPPVDLTLRAAIC